MQRRRVKGNKQCQQPTAIIFLDCETTENDDATDPTRHVHNFRLGVTSYYRRFGKDWRHQRTNRFTDRHSLWRYIFSLCRRRGVLWVYAHNACFDLTVSSFWAYLDGREVILEGILPHHYNIIDCSGLKLPKWHGLFAVDDRKTIIECAHHNGRLNIVDSRNYFRSSLDAIGAEIGIPKLPMPRFEDDDEAWFTYCERDVSILATAIIQLMNEWTRLDMGNWQTTAAGLAWSSYRHRFMPVPISSHDHADAMQLERDGYHGGEVRTFFVGDVYDREDAAQSLWANQPVRGRPFVEGPVHLYDVRSLYPHCMATYPMPYELQAHFGYGTTASLERFLPDRYVIARVLIHSELSRYPYRLRSIQNVARGDRLIFPAGLYETTLCGPELRDALDRHAVEAVFEFAVYRQANIFRDYVSHWWGERQRAEASGQSVRSNLCKLMLNTLYGRFGMGRLQWVIEPNLECIQNWGTWVHHDYEKQEYVKCRGVAGVTLAEKPAPLQEFQLTAIAAAVTAAGRHYMRAIRDRLPERSCLYQDTDSLLVTEAGMLALESVPGLIGESIGQLSPKCSRETARIYGIRNYDIGPETVIAGLPRRHHHIAGRTYTAKVFESPESILTRQCPDTVNVTERTLDYSSPENYDQPQLDGWTVPYRLYHSRYEHYTPRASRRCTVK